MSPSAILSLMDHMFFKQKYVFMSLQIMLELHGIHDLAKNGVLGVKMLSSDPRKTWEFLHWGNKEEKVPYCFKYQIGKRSNTFWRNISILYTVIFTRCYFYPCTLAKGFCTVWNLPK